MQHEHAVKVVQAWQNALNQQDSALLTQLSDPQIEIVGPRGSAYGHQVLREWLQHAGLTLTTQRIFGRDAVVAVAQHAVWQSEATGGVPSAAAVASVFRVYDGRVVSYARYDSLSEALANAGLTQADEVARG